MSSLRLLSCILSRDNLIKVLFAICGVAAQRKFPRGFIWVEVQHSWRRAKLARNSVIFSLAREP
jgi:hypothetical protein